jgi:hypothetical protein
MKNKGIYLTQPHFGYRSNEWWSAKNLKTPFSVIPAKAGIQCFQGSLDAGSSPA